MMKESPGLFEVQSTSQTMPLYPTEAKRNGLKRQIDMTSRRDVIPRLPSALPHKR